MLFITWIASPTKEGCHWQVGAENCQTGQLANPAWYPQPTIATTDIQEAVVVGLATDIKSQWRHNWKSAQVVNSYLVCNPTIRQLGFNLSRQQWSLLNRFRTEQTLRCLQKEMATHRHWSVSLWWYPDDGPHCWILSSDKAERQLIPAYTLQTKPLFRGRPIMVHDTHMRRRRLCVCNLPKKIMWMLSTKVNLEKSVEIRNESFMYFTLSP